MHCELMDRSSLRRTNVNALELVFGSDPTFHEFGALALDFAKLLRDFASQILVYLDDLKLDLANLALCLC